MISAVVLTHNDEGTIERCLKSLLWCDEIVVIDDSSKDATRVEAKKFGAIVYEHPLGNDFAGQRNFGLQKVKGEWVIYVDSDEVVSKDLAGEITSRIKSTIASGFIFHRHDYWGGEWLRHGETANVALLRLAKKTAGKWERPVHEVWNISGITEKLKNPLLHYPHPNVAQFLEEINWYSTLNAQYLYAQRVRVHWWDIILYPKAKFIVNYLLRLGFLDGTPGAIVAIMMSFHSFLTRGKLYLLAGQRQKIH